jgi:hypothetical protein
MRGIVLGTAVVIILAVAVWGSIVVSDSLWRSINDRGDKGLLMQAAASRSSTPQSQLGAADRGNSRYLSCPMPPTGSAGGNG